MTPSARTISIGLTVLAIALCCALIYPFAGALFVAAVLAGALTRVCDRLSRALGDRRPLAAFLLTVGVVLVVVLPVSFIAAVVIRELVDGIRYVRDILHGQGTAGLISALPASLQGLGQRALDWFAQSEKELTRWFGAEGGTAAVAVGVMLAHLGDALGKTVLMLIALFSLLVDGRPLITWIDEATPLPRGQLRELLADFRSVTVAVLISTGATALVQALVALVGFLIARVPHASFFALVTFFLAFVPGGPVGVSLLLALFVWASGHPWAALFLALWAALVGLVDNIVKPLFMRGGVRIPGAVIFFAFLGGLALFGPVGLLVGPLVVSFLMALVRMQKRERAVAAAADVIK